MSRTSPGLTLNLMPDPGKPLIKHFTLVIFRLTFFDYLGVPTLSNIFKLAGMDKNIHLAWESLIV